uniref:Uncharacterized protein n=1 Tax=Magallana gigas TaxID=29159 RepID=K1PFQ9_MAGGI
MTDSRKKISRTLKYQFMLGVYIVRTEKAEDRQRIQGEVDWRSGGQAENRRRQGQDPPNPRTRGLENIEKTKGYILGGVLFDVPLVLHLQLLNTLQGIPLHQNPGVIQLNPTLCLLQIPRPKTL